MARVKFGDVIREVKVNVDRTNNPYEFFVAGDHMDTDSLEIRRRGRFEGSVVGPAFTRLFRPGQVLYGSRRTYLRKVAVADFEGVTANTTFVLETKDESVFMQQLLPFLMLTEDFTSFSVKNSKGSTNPYILFSDIAKYEFDLPTIERQRELSAILWAFNETRNAYKHLLAATDDLVKSQFIEMFGDPVTNPMGWPQKHFGEFASIDASMTTDYAKYANSPHIGIDSIEKSTGKLRGYRTVAEDGVKSGKYIFTPDHIIYSKIRPNLNKVALPSFTGLCSADSYPILPNAKNCNRTYLAFVLRSDWFLSYIVPFSNRSNMPKVNRQQISGFVWPLPPIELQNQFSAFVESTDKSKFALQQNIERLEMCRNALMQKAFS